MSRKVLATPTACVRTLRKAMSLCGKENPPKHEPKRQSAIPAHEDWRQDMNQQLQELVATGWAMDFRIT